MITQKQRDFLDELNNFIDKNGYCPSIREICEITGLKSTATVHGYITRLTERGLLIKQPNKNRTLKTSIPAREKHNSIPIIGTITAGVPILAEENIEGFFPISESFARGRDLFILKVSGDSMKNAGILDGDKIIIQKQETAINGQIVAAMIDDTATVKRFYKEKGHYRLQPENEAYKPIICDCIHIIGIVVGLYREF